MKHSETSSPEWLVWWNMICRCSRPSHSAYKNYGGRGIAVCEEWSGTDGYERFLLDMGRRPSAEHSIDRIDNNMGYSKRNCRWATRKEQCRNRRSNKLITIGNETKCMTEWAETYGIPVVLFKERVAANWDPLTALTSPMRGSAEIIIGSVFNLWTVISPGDKRVSGKRTYICRCRCGNESIVDSYDLRHGISKGCINCGRKGNQNARKKFAEGRLDKGHWVGEVEKMDLHGSRD